MKVCNKEELKAIAADIFQRYPKAQKVAITTDGEAFIVDESDNAARNHAVKNRHGKELAITYFTRDELSAAASGDNSAAGLIASIKETLTVEEVEAIMLSESNGKNRKSVIDAACLRIKELKGE